MCQAGTVLAQRPDAAEVVVLTHNPGAVLAHRPAGAKVTRTTPHESAAKTNINFTDIG
jgi:hypothetical protein